MTKRKALIVGFVMATVVCAVPGVAYLFRDPINRSSCDKIQKGMTEAEVTWILGRPGDEILLCSALWMERNSEGVEREKTRNKTIRIWNGPAGSIIVGFDKTGVVEFATFAESGNSVWRRVRRWVGLDPPFSSSSLGIAY